MIPMIDPVKIAPEYLNEAASLLRKARARYGDSHCHAVRYRVSDSCPVDQLRRNFRELMRELSALAYGKEVTATVLWVEAVGSNAGSSIAQQRRRAELRRPVLGSPGPAWRAVLLEYKRGGADLILVAQRSLLDSASLQILANAIILGRSVSQTSSPEEREFNLPDARALQLPEDSPFEVSWGMGSDAAGRRKILSQDLVPKPRIDLPVLTAAVGIAAARYAGSKMHLLAAVARTPGRGHGQLGAFEGMALLPIALDEGMLGCQVVSQAKKDLKIPIRWHDEATTALLKAKYGSGAAVHVGVFSGEPQSLYFDGLRPDEYQPFLEPPYPLTICLRSKENQRQIIDCDYATDMFDTVVVEQFAASIAGLAGNLAAAQDQQLSQLELLSAAEHGVVAGLGPPGRRARALRQRIDQTFARVVSQYPLRPALVFGEERLSYQELDQRANQAARALRARGVRTGHRVGICVERSLELVVIILAITKTGAAYVPMDTECPSDRLAYMASDAAVNVVVTSRSDFPMTDQAKIVCLADLALKETEDAVELAEHGGTDEDIAYIIYTSGSTGRPKGVAIQHRSVLGLLAATQSDFELSSQDVWTLFHASAFDFSVWEMWGSLLTGGSLIVVPFSVSRSPVEFQEMLAKERVTVLNQTPSAFAQLIDADRARSLPLVLRLIIFGGEPLNPRMLLSWFDRWPESRCRVVNMFGITETTVHVTRKTITRDDALKASRSVGRALPGWHVYVMDTAGRLVPPGVSGEICVGGQGVAAFYLNKPGLTAERFIPDPYAPGRIYCSGDKGRLRPNGELEHLGRIDGQVKLRGFRIEVDEIRAVLLGTPGVSSAAVVFRQEDPNDAATARLDAYVAADNCSADEVRRHINRILPDYMRPATVTVLPSLPLTSNGKLDVEGLSKPAALPPAASGEQSGGLADALRRIWQKVLKAPVALDDNFFDLGGNSLYAARIAAAMREQQLPAIPLREIYVHQTVRKIAEAVHPKGGMAVL